MGFLERSRSLRRKDSAVPLKKADQSPVAQAPENAKGSRERSATVAAQYGRPSTTSSRGTSSKGPKEDNRPRTAGQGKQPPMPGAILDMQAFKFPSASASPRSTTSHSRNLTIHGNGSSAAVSMNSQGKAPEYKRSFTSPVAQATVHNGMVQLSTKSLPKLEPSPTPTPTTTKRPTLHKSKSSTWRSFFQRKPSKPSVADMDYAEDVPPLPAKVISTPSPAVEPVKKDKVTDSPPSQSVQQDKPLASAPAPAPPQTHSRQESRGMMRQNIRAEIDKAQFEARAAYFASLAKSESRATTQQQLKPQMARTNTTASTVSSAVSETFFDALSRVGTQNGQTPSTPGGKPHTPRLEVSIPTVEMERYSVMFEKLLKPKQTILERRKTTIQGLHLPGEQPNPELLSASLETPGAPKRRATSPNLTVPTPLTAEFLECSSQMATPVAIHRVSAIPRVQLRRSRTAPPGGFADEQQQQQQQQQPPRKQSAGDNTSSACSTNNSMWSEASDVPATPDTNTETETFMSLNNDDEDEDDDEEEEDEEEAEIVTFQVESLKPKLKEPSWNMMTRTTPTALEPPPIPPKAAGRISRDVSQERPFPPRSTSLGSTEMHTLEGVRRTTQAAQPVQPQAQAQAPAQAQEPAKREPHPNPLQMNRPTQPVQMGIARQVSVRRPVGSHAGTSNRSARATAQPISLYSKQPLKPQLVEVRNRKSTMIVLETASSSSGSKESLVPTLPSVMKINNVHAG